MASTNLARNISVLILSLACLFEFVIAASSSAHLELRAAKNPAKDPNNHFHYIPSNTLTTIGVVLFGLVTLIETILIVRKRGRYMACMVIGEYTYTAGLIIRYALHTNPDSKGLSIAENLLVILSPCAFIAASYVLLGRMSRWLKCDQHLLVAPRRITLVFVSSDIVTFLIQAAGASLLLSDNPTTVLHGSHILLAGLVLQVVSFGFFITVYIRFLWAVRRHQPGVWSRDAGKPWYSNWRALSAALLISCLGILLRSIYRTVEFGEGPTSKAATTEGFFYGFDTLPLFIGLLVYIPFWPGRFIPWVDMSRKAVEQEEMATLNGNDQLRTEELKA